MPRPKKPDPSPATLHIRRLEAIICGYERRVGALTRDVANLLAQNARLHEQIEALMAAQPTDPLNPIIPE